MSFNTPLGFGAHWASAQSHTRILEKLQNSRYPKNMDTTQQREKERREQILGFWNRHGLSATADAYQVSRATLYRWQKDSVPKSRRHASQYQKRIIDPLLEGEIVRVRKLHPRLGKEKLTPLLARFCSTNHLPVLSEPTIGRMLAHLKSEGKLPSHKKLRLNAKTGRLLERTEKKTLKLRRKEYRPGSPGGLIQIDAITTFVNGLKRYTVTAVDLPSRFAFAYSYSSLSSRSAKDFLEKLLLVTPFTITHIQTDNGLEFHKEFREAATAASLVHFFNYPRKPTQNAFIERFNRSIQEEFLSFHTESLAYNLENHNLDLMEYLLWYNGERVHHSLGKYGQRLTPLQYLGLTGESHLAWAHTTS